MRRLRKSSINSQFITSSRCLRRWIGDASTSSRPDELGEAPLLPPVLSDWRSGDHVVCVVSESVDQLEPRAFDALASHSQVDERPPFV
jgi:hypothetical protein